MVRAVLLDSGFLIRLMNPEDDLHQVALDYFKSFVLNGISCMVSTIAVAEYGVKGDLRYLPTVIQPRVIIPNDTKMFA